MAAFTREVSRPSRKASDANSGLLSRRASADSGFAPSRKASDAHSGPFSRRASVDSGFTRQLSQEEIAFHKETTAIAKDVLTKLMDAGDGEDFDKADGSDGLGPPTADVPDAHFQRRLLANEVLAATEDYMYNVQWNVQPAAEDAADGAAGPPPKAGAASPRTVSCVDLAYLGEGATANPLVAAALETALKERGLLLEAAAFDQFDARSNTRKSLGAIVAPGAAKKPAPPGGGDFGARAQSVQVGALARLFSSQRSAAGYGRRSSLFAVAEPQAKPARRASVLHDSVKQALKNHGPDAKRVVPPSSEKPALKDPMGLRCVEHLYDPKWTRLARAIRESIYDPDFYDDGTYGPMYVRLAIHGAATWDQHDQTGGLEGGAMRYKPEYSDAHNKFCKEVVKRQHEVLKVPFPWASYADIQCLCSYVALECADGPVIPFTPGRRDIVPNKNLADPAKDLGDDDFVYLNYRERGDAGCEDQPVKRCPASGKAGAGAGECPFLTKARVMPGRLPGPEQGHLGKPFAPVKPEDEAKELREVAKEIRHIFVDRIGASEQFTVALIAGGHSLGRCHPQISGYAGPWQSNPGYFNNVYCKKLMSDDWKLVDRNMEDCSGDVITGLRPYGMRRQYVNEGGKGDIMMLVSDMALKDDPQFGYWIQHYALDNEALKRDFAAAFKWITEVGFEPPREKRGLPKLLFHLRKFRADALKWVGEHLCPDASDGAAGGPVFIAADAPKVGKPYTLDEVKAHASGDDCWVAINGKVCDLTKFMGTHPGGVGPIMSKAGTDASTEWNTIHNKDAIEKICPEVVIGYLVASKGEGAGVPQSIMGA